MKHAKIILALMLCAGCSESPQEQKATYDAWMMVHPQYHQLTFVDWENLREHEMLPGVDYALMHTKRAEESANEAAAYSAVNMINSAASRK